jgi:hypothetical protein
MKVFAVEEATKVVREPHFYSTTNTAPSPYTSNLSSTLSSYYLVHHLFERVNALADGGKLILFVLLAFLWFPAADCLVTGM